MSHRVKNLLAIASGLAAITPRSTANVADMTRELTQRLQAFGREHDLVRPLPSDEGSAALLGDLLTILLAPYDGLGAFSGDIRVAISRTGVGERAAQMLALIFHELGTFIKLRFAFSGYRNSRISGVPYQDQVVRTPSHNFHGRLCNKVDNTTHVVT